MEVYSIEITLESPLVSTEEQIGNVLRHSGAYIKGRVIRGAVLNSLYIRNPNAVKDEVMRPKLIFHPAYPVKDGGVCKPAHPLTFSCKICRKPPRGYDSSPYKLLKAFESGEFRLPVFCEKGHPLSMSPKGGMLLDGRGEGIELRSLRMESVGINRFLKSSEMGMLYGYVALPPGLTFRGLVVDRAGKVRDLEIDGIEEIRMGRGVSRGMGKASVKIKLMEDGLDKEVRRIEDIMNRSGGLVVLRALSHVFHLKMDSDGLISLPLPEVRGEGISEVQISPYGSLGGNAIFTKLSEVLGFSSVSRLPIPRIVGADVGSLFFYRVSMSSLSDAARYLAEREFLGFGPFSASGLNLLEVMDYE
ncbi:MAG: hypothetical protein QW092_03485 [Candidatus Korarchaeum sp.]